MYLIDYLHQHGIGVILDWVPSHFTTDEHGLGYFDGTHLYEHADPRRGVHPDWHSYLFNYGRNEVRAFLLELRPVLARQVPRRRPAHRRRGLDALPRLLPAPKANGCPTAFGGRENLEAIHFLRTLNENVYANYPDAVTIAEESTAWPMVSRPVYVGGLGFGYKWDMGWMHDTLEYMRQDPIFRKYHHDKATFRMVYAFTENFILPLSHDEVVYGKGSLLAKMPGDALAEVRQPAARCSATCTPSRARSCCSWAASSASGTNGTTTSELDWQLLQYEPHRRPAAVGRRPQPRSTGGSRRCTSSIATRAASNGSTAATAIRAC